MLNSKHNDVARAIETRRNHPEAAHGAYDMSQEYEYRKPWFDRWGWVAFFTVITWLGVVGTVWALIEVMELFH